MLKLSNTKLKLIGDLSFLIKNLINIYSLFL